MLGEANIQLCSESTYLHYLRSFCYTWLPEQKIALHQFEVLKLFYFLDLYFSEFNVRDVQCGVDGCRLLQRY